MIPICNIMQIIERHFTLDKTQKGTDHKCSLVPSEFKEMVQGIRQVEMAIGFPNKVSRVTI